MLQGTNLDCVIPTILYNMLQGTNLDSVQPSEIRIFVGGEPCNIEVQQSSEQVKVSKFSKFRIIAAIFPILQLFCLPPQEAPDDILEAPVLVCTQPSCT